MPKTHSDRRDRLEFAAAMLPVRALRAMTFPRAFRAGEVVGSLLFRVARSQRRVALVNLRIAFPEKSEAEHLAIFHEACRNFGRMAAEFCHMRDLTRENLPRFVRFADPDDWAEKEKVVGKTGILVLGGHFGNWELQSYAFGLLGHPLHFIHRPFHNERFTEWMLAERGRAGTGLISKRNAAIGTMKVLKRKGIVGVPIDQNATGRWGVFADFFGVPASTHPGLARLAQMSGAPVYPAFIVRQHGGMEHRIEVHDPVEVVDTGDRDADTVENLTRFNRVFEDVVRRHPDHWIWMHKRWKTRPPGEPSLY